VPEKSAYGLLALDFVLKFANGVIIWSSQATCGLQSRHGRGLYFKLSAAAIASMREPNGPSHRPVDGSGSVRRTTKRQLSRWRMAHLSAARRKIKYCGGTVYSQFINGSMHLF
jgi:hypothetical protein